jgi:hypothetical protein
VTPEDLTEWEDALEGGDEQVWLVLVLISLENLRYLEMRHYAYVWDLTLRTLAQLASNSVSVWGYTPLSHLEEVSIMSETVYQNFPAAQFAPFFKLPAMRVFRAAGVQRNMRGTMLRFRFL